MKVEIDPGQVIASMLGPRPHGDDHVVEGRASGRSLRKCQKSHDEINVKERKVSGST